MLMSPVHAIPAAPKHPTALALFFDRLGHLPLFPRWIQPSDWST